MVLGWARFGLHCTRSDTMVGLLVLLVLLVLVLLTPPAFLQT
jgi:hypothetical protein